MPNIKSPGDSADAALLRRAMAAKFLGVSKDVLDGLALRGEVPYYLIGSMHKRFKPEDLAAYREANRGPARPRSRAPETITALHARMAKARAARGAKKAQP